MYLGKTCLLITLISFLGHVMCYPNGIGVDESCNTMLPTHGSTKKSPPAPYNIAFCPDWYQAGTTVTVTISNKTATPFRGFMAQARLLSSINTKLGTFQTTSYSRTACSSNALVHNGNSNKAQITFQWNAPTPASGNISFWVTFVQEEHTYWVAVPSGVIMDATGLNKTAPNCTSPMDINSSVQVGFSTVVMFILASFGLFANY